MLADHMIMAMMQLSKVSLTALNFVATTARELSCGNRMPGLNVPRLIVLIVSINRHRSEA